MYVYGILKGAMSFSLTTLALTTSRVFASGKYGRERTVPVLH
jgi:hypothetical protein